LQRTITDKPKEWQGFATEVHKGAIQLAEAIKARDGSAGMDAVAKITTNCTGCHKAFRASK
jgi:cytochrome c556